MWSCLLRVLEVQGTQEKTATDHLSQNCFISPNHDLSTKYPGPLIMVYNYTTTIARQNLAENNTEKGPILRRVNYISSVAVRIIRENKQ